MIIREGKKMDTSILLTIIVPAYNVEQWIKRCINSILNQTYRNIEVIVIDDGSTDNTAKLLDEFALNDKRIVIIHQNNAGLVAVREKGISLAKGDYVGFVGIFIGILCEVINLTANH